MYLIGDVSLEERRHADQCAACRARIDSLAASLANFRGAVRNWSGRAAAQSWTVIPATDQLDRLLLPAIADTSWARSLWSNLRDLLTPERPLPDITSKPVLVRDIWGQYGHQKKSWVLSVALQSIVVMSVFAVASTQVAPNTIGRIIPLIGPIAMPEELPPAKQAMSGGGGGGDRSPIPASKGRLPKAALKQFTPPVAVLNNPDARLTMEPTMVAPPDIALPQVNLAQYGDPLAKLGPPSNGPGRGGGIGTGGGGGVGAGLGPGVGDGLGGGIGGGVFRVGGGVSAPALIYKVEPEYSEEARKAKYQGTVLLYIEVDYAGRAQNIRVARSMGLGLDEKAIEAVKKWKFRPGMKDGKPVIVAATIEVNFRLL
jgi:protein TonB